MTPAQKKNVARFKAAAAEAKKIRAKDPKLTQAEAVKKAFAKLYGVKKTVTRKIVAKKKTATRQPVAKKKTATKKYSEYHKDTMSHNVNIRVMSGVFKTYIVLFDTGNDFETVKIQAVDMRSARAIASRIKRDDAKLKNARTSVRLYKK